MEQKNSSMFDLNQTRATRLFHPEDQPTVRFPIQEVYIDWDRLRANRPLVLREVEGMHTYLLKPEVIELLRLEKDPTYRLVLDLMWSTGARISEVLGLTRGSFKDDGYGFGVWLKTLKRQGRPSTKTLQRSSQRFVAICDQSLKDRIQSYLYVRHLRSTQRLFKMSRQSVNRHIYHIVDLAGGADFRISSHTFRHSFAVHLLLHGRPLKVISKLLGHRSVQTTEIYTNVLTVDVMHFLEGVDFH